MIISSLSPRRLLGTSSRQDLEVSGRKAGLCCDGPTNITACFIDTDCSDTSKSGPINLQADDGVTGTCEGATAANVCLSSCRGGLDGPEPKETFPSGGQYYGVVHVVSQWSF